MTLWLCYGEIVSERTLKELPIRRLPREIGEINMLLVDFWHFQGKHAFN